MNPYGISSKPDRHAVYTEIRELYGNTQASIDEYALHPFSYCTHNGNCTRAARRRKAAAR